MNYIYDILLNFQEMDYDFYEWNTQDNILHIRKIPLVKVSRSLMSKILHYHFSVSIEFLKKISNRTEVFSNKNIKVLKYVCLFSDGYEAVAIQFTNDGTKEKVSRLLLDEKEDILEIANNVDSFKLEINLLDKIKSKQFRTRKEEEINQYIKKEFQRKNYERLKYTYLECFNEEEQDYEKIVSRLKIALDNNWHIYYQKVYNILKLSSMKKSKN